MRKSFLCSFAFFLFTLAALADSHKIIPSAGSPATELPSIISGINGAPDWIQLAKSVDGVSINQFDDFNLNGEPPLFKADSNTKKVIINVNGAQKSLLSQSRNIGVIAKKDVLVSLVLRSTAGFICSGCSFLGLNIEFESGNFLVNGAGMNATHGLSVHARRTQVDAPLLVADTLHVNGDFFLSSSAYARNIKIHNATKTHIPGTLVANDSIDIQSKSVGIDGVIQGLLVDVDAETLTVAKPETKFHGPSHFWIKTFPKPLLVSQPARNDKSGIFAQAPIDQNKVYVTPHEKRHLKIKSTGVTNFGVLASEGIIDFNLLGPLHNYHRIESKENMQIAAKQLSNSKGMITSQADLTLGTDSSRIKSIENLSGTIRSKGKMHIFSDALKNFRLGINSIAEVSIKNNRTLHRVKADFQLPLNYNAIEEETIQELSVSLNTGSLALISSSGGIDFHCNHIHNSLSRIESLGDVWIDDKYTPEIIVEGLRLSRFRDIHFIDLPLRPPAFHDTDWNHAMNQRCEISSVYADALRGTGPFWATQFSPACHRAFRSKSPTLFAKNKDKIQIIRLDPPKEKSFCKKVDIFPRTWFCEPTYSPISADLVYGGTFFGNVKSLQLYEWVKPQKGPWVKTQKNAQWRKEQITIDDQMIPIVDNGSLQRLIEMESFAHLLGPHLPEATKADPSNTALWGDSADYPGMSSLATIAANIPHRTLAPAVEYRALLEALAVKVGHSDVTPSELLQNTPQAMKEFNFGFGQCPRPEQITNAPYPFLCSGFYEDPQDSSRKILIPIAIIPRDLVAKWRSESAAQVTGDIIDLTVEGNAHIDGAIKAIKGALKLRAENLVLHGEISSEGDIDLHANKQLILESIVDEVTGALTKRTKLKANGSVKASSGGDFKAVGTEVSGENIIVRAEGEMIIIPTHVFEELSASFNEGGLSVQQRITCERLYGNLWTAKSGNIDVNAQGEVKIEGGEFSAKEKIHVKSEKARLDVKPTIDKCNEFLSKQGWFYSYENKKKTEEVKQVVFNADEIEMTAEKDAHFTSPEMNAKTVNLSAKGDVIIDSTKSTCDETTKEDSFSLFGWHGLGFSLFESTTNRNHDYNEHISGAHLNAENVHIKADGKVAVEDLDINSAQQVEINAKKGIFRKDNSERHEHSSSSRTAGLFVGINLDEGEFSFGVGGFCKTTDHVNKATTYRPSTWKAARTILISEGDVTIQGTIHSDVEINAQNISLQATKGQLCLGTKDLSAQFGIRAGLKSRLTKALAHTLQLKDAKVEVWEDGVNLGFRCLASGVELASGLLIPLEGGIWLHSKVAYKSEDECFDLISSPTLVGDNISLTAQQCIELEAAKLEGVNGNIKSKCLKVRSMTKESSSSQLHANVDGDIPLQGANAPNLSSQGAFHKASSSQHLNTHINFDTLKMRVEDKASFMGAVVEAKVLDAEFGELLLESMRDESSSAGVSGSISLNPLQLSDALESVLGGGAGVNAHSKSVVRELTVLLGSNSATVVVKGVARLVGSMIANAEKNPDGTYTDKGNLIFKAGQLLYEDIQNHNQGIDVDFHVSKGFNKAVKATVEATFGFASQGSTAKATLGHGKVEITTDDDDDEFAFKNINRDVNKAQSEWTGPILNPIRAYLPVVNLDDDGKHLANYFKAIAECATGTKCFGNSLEAIWRGMTWFNKPGKLPKDQKEWRELLKNIEFLDEAEIDQIIDEVAQETKAIEEKIAQELAKKEGNAEKDRNTELAKDLLIKAKDASIAAKVLDAKSKSKYKTADSKTDSILASLSAERMLAHADHLVGSTDDAVSKYLREVIGWEFWNTVQKLDLELSAEQKAIMAFTASVVDGFEQMRFYEVNTRIEVLSQFENYILSLLKVYGGASAIRAARAPGIGLYMAIPCFILGFDSIQSGFSSIAKKEQQELATVRALEIAGMSGNWVHALDLAMAVGTLRGIPEHLIAKNKKNAEIIIRALEKSSRSKLGKSTGTIWDFIKATQPVPKGSLLPKSFELIAGKTKVWVSPNAVKHMNTYTMALARRGVDPKMLELAAHFQLKSLAAAVTKATKNGVVYGKEFKVGEWELVFGPPREAGKLPAIIHALRKSP